VLTFKAEVRVNNIKDSVHLSKKKHDFSIEKIDLLMLLKKSLFTLRIIQTHKYQKQSYWLLKQMYI
jgi:hypothetical protein